MTILNLRRLGLVAGTVLLIATTAGAQQRLILPYADSASNQNPLFSMTNTFATICPSAPCPVEYGAAIFGESKLVGSTDEVNPKMGGTGVVGRNLAANGFGIRGLAPQGVGVKGEGRIGTQGEGLPTVFGSTGVYGESTSDQGVGVRGSSTKGSGVEGDSSSRSSYGVEGTNSSGVGVRGGSGGNESNSYGVLGEGKYGVVGKSTKSGNSSGVYGLSEQGFAGVEGHGRGKAYGVWAQTTGDADAIHAETSGGTSAIYGKTTGSGFAGFFEGRVRVKGMLEKPGGGFKIDHPLDPERKYLSHSFVESPDMMNVYNGNIVLNSKGETWVELPEWFETLNREFRYQLTAIGTQAPGLYIAEEIFGNRFKIAGGKPGSKVSWQVTGIRQDRYAEAYRIKTEEEKSGGEVGLYLHPELYGESNEKRVASESSMIKSARNE